MKHLRLMVPLCVALIGGCQQPAFSPSQLGKEAHSSYQVLLNTDVFATTAVGYAATPSEGAIAFRTLRHDAHAHDAFMSLLNHAKIPGKLYALCYLYQADPDAFWKAVPQFLEMNDKVLLEEGCIGSGVRICEVVDASFRPGRTIDEAATKAMRLKSGWIYGCWYARNPSGVTDIVGGGYPDELWNFRTKEESDELAIQWLQEYMGMSLDNVRVTNCRFYVPQAGTEFSPSSAGEIYVAVTCDVEFSQKLLKAGKPKEELREFLKENPYRFGSPEDVPKMNPYELPSYVKAGFVYKIAFAVDKPNRTLWIWSEFELPKFTLTSPAFKDGQPIPAKYTDEAGEGKAISPPLKWSGAPAGTKQFVLIVEDLEVPGFTHWIVFGMPASMNELVENAMKLQLPHGVGQSEEGYRGMSPPEGDTHRYVFRLYALKAMVKITPEMDKNEAVQEMAGHVLATAELKGTYKGVK